MIWCIIGYLCVASVTLAANIPRHELDPEHWFQSGRNELENALRHNPVTSEARNVIVFLGDGMGLSTVTAARIYKGQLDGKSGEETKLSFEDFPNIGLAKTYSVDHQIPDSSATATAFLCGLKTRFGTVGLNAQARRGSCRESRNKNATCIMQLFQQKGKATGIVTTARVTHATPAPSYAWSPERTWESDIDLTPEARKHGCRDIASQLVDDEPGSNINVLFGGGRGNFLPDNKQDPEHPGRKGRRQDGRNLIKEWLEEKQGHNRSAQFVWNERDFQNLDANKVDFALGLFEHSHMHFEGFRDKDNAGEPSLADMTEKAIKILQKNKKGYFLLVEGARIDHAHHANGARVALEETLALESAIQRAKELVNDHDTLMIVTADHSHPLNLASYSKRGNNILGLGDYNDDKTERAESDVDGLPYTTLNYATGPGYQFPRVDLSHNDTESRHYRQTSAVPLREGTHDGTDVPVYASGPWAHLFHSTHEQHYIFHAISFAACVNDDSIHGHTNTEPHCRRSPRAYDYKHGHNVEVYQPQHMTSSFTITSGSQTLCNHILFLFVSMQLSMPYLTAVL